MKTSDLMASMAAAGAPMEAILIAVRAIEERDEAMQAKRAVERERKRRQRAKDRDEDGTVTGQSRDIPGTVTDNPSPSFPPLSSPQTPQQTPPTHPHPDNNTRARKGAGLVCPSDVSETVWRDTLAHRKALKKPLTETALVGIRREADKAGWPIEAALVEMVSRGWQGFKADWVEAVAKPSIVPGVSIDPLTQAEKTAALYRRMGREDDAKAEEERAARLRSGSGPPRPIGQIVAGLNAPH